MRSNLVKVPIGLVTGALVLFICSCIEEVELGITSSPSDPEGALIVEALITDIPGKQEILLSMAAGLNDTSTIQESNARVSVVDDQGNSFTFLEGEAGRYISQEDFHGQQGVTYQLTIETAEGGRFESIPVLFEGTSTIADLRAERALSNSGGTGVAITVNGVNELGVNTFRYTYEETYQIIAPTWSPFEFAIRDDSTFDIVPREEEERVCFNTVRSTDIILSGNLTTPANTIESNQIRFLGQDNFIISHRYSILVKQFLHSREGYDFYSVLNAFSSSDNVFATIQPGFLEGNIKAVNTGRKVIGLFDVVAVAEQRLFFSYSDFFPNEPLPPYPFVCRVFSPTTTDEIFLGRVEYVGENTNPGTDELPILVTNIACGDCTVLGNNIVPDFWEE